MWVHNNQGGGGGSPYINWQMGVSLVSSPDSTLEEGKGSGDIWALGILSFAKANQIATL